MYNFPEFPSVTWHCGEPIPQHLVEATSDELDVSFPSSYLQICLNADGAVPEPDVFLCDGIERSFGRLLSHNPSRRDTLLKFAGNEIAFVPEGVIPFAIGPFGDLVCFDYRQGGLQPNAIVYCAHEGTSASRQPVGVASTFDELIASLRDDSVT